MQTRNKKGQFDRKSSTDRKVRSIRVTDEAWSKFGEMASQLSITRADLLENFITNNSVLHGSDEIIQILKDALKLRANAGGAIKEKIRIVLELLNI